MLNTPLIRFGQIREAALERWKIATGRSLINLSTIPGTIMIDDFSIGNYECKWQYDARKIKADNDWHVSQFCSLGDWAGNITDILTDFRFDSIPIGLLGYDSYNQSLFRYYTRLMLIISEIMTDFVDLLIAMSICADNTAARKLLSNTVNVQELFDYINSICKHKTATYGNLTKLHQCNHHLSFFIEDSHEKQPFSRPLKIGNNRETDPDGVIVPKLSILLSAVLDGYDALDTAFLNEPQKFEQFISDKGDHVP